MRGSKRERPREGIEGRLPERVFWADAGQNRRPWLRKVEARREELTAL